MIPVHRERRGQRAIPVHRERKASKAQKALPVLQVRLVREVRLVLLALKVRRDLLGPSDLRVYLPLQQVVLSGYVLAMGHKYVGVLAPAIAQIRLSNFRSLLLISITQ